MLCVATGIGAASWSAALVLAVVGTINQNAHAEIIPWMLVTLAIGITAAICIMVERSRALVLQTMHAEFEGEVTERHLSAI